MIEDEYLEEDEGPRQPPLYLITGLVLGLGLGLLISLVLSPVRYVDTAPASLQAQYKDFYRMMIAQAYQSNQDLPRARQRLLLLEENNPAEALAAQAQQLLGQGGDEDLARALAELSADLSAPPGGQPAPVQVSTSTPTGGPQALSSPQPFETLDLAQAVQTATQPPPPSPTAGPTFTPMPTFTPRAALTPLPTLGARFELASRQEVCDPSVRPGLLQIELRDRAGRPLPGVQITVAWDGGLDTFFTGLHPDRGAGYADFVMEPGVVYSLRVSDLSETINGLSAPSCNADGGPAFTGGLRLEFSQP